MGNSISIGKTTTSTVTQTQIITTYANLSNSTQTETTNTTFGLELLLTLNSTIIQDGGAINVTVTISNTLPHANNVSGENKWAIPSLTSSASFPCQNYVYYQVFQGIYSESNISSAANPLQVSPVYQSLSCIILQRPYYVFQPLSDQASIPVGQYTSNSSTFYQTTFMRISEPLIGNYSSVYNASVFTQAGTLPPPPFHPGNYTIIAGDEWGQLVLLHFTVTNNSVQVSSSNTISANTFFSTSCSISGVGGFEFRLVSDSTGQPINASSISAVDKLGCNQENQAVYLNQFSYLGDGWFVPMFPSQATVGGGLNVTVTYQGETYNFAGYYPPVGTDCVTLHVPSGNVTSSTAMNGSGSYCS